MSKREKSTLEKRFWLMMLPGLVILLMIIVDSLLKGGKEEAAPAMPVAEATDASKEPQRRARVEVERGRPEIPAVAPPAREAASFDPPASARSKDLLLRFDGKPETLQWLDGLDQAGIQVRTIPELNAVRLRFDSAEQAQTLLSTLPEGVETAWNYTVEAPMPVASEPEALVPFGDTALAWLGVEEAHQHWGAGVRIAVLDSGVNPHVTFNEARIHQVDLLGTPAGGPDGYYDGHGSAVVSLLAGQLDGAKGIVPSAEIISIRVLDENGLGDQFTVAAGIVEAVDRGTKVINLSLGAYEDSFVLREAVDYALAAGVALVAATGNEGYQQVAYPAAYTGVLAVGAVDASGEHAYFSNTGSAVDILAPGVGVDSAWTGNGKTRFSGTSAATPFVAGALAAILARDPQLDVLDAQQLLLDYADEAGLPGRDTQHGAGLLSLERLLRMGDSDFRDLRMADFVLTEEGLAGDQPYFQAVVHNRGNSQESASRLRVTLDGVEEYYDLAALAPGAVGVVEIPFLPGQDEIPVAFEIQSANTDVHPENDRLEGVIEP